MNTKREIKSFWWSPEHPETKWFGTLSLHSDKTPGLEIFVERENSAGELRQVGRVIHGMDEHGEPITLLFVSSPSDTISGAVAKRRFHVGYVLIGIALPNPESFVANLLRFQVQHLYGWLGRSGFKRAASVPSSTFTVEFQHLPDEWFSVTPDLDLAIHNTYSLQDGCQEKRISEDAALSFRTKSGFSLTRCRKMIGKIRSLLHFASLKKVYPTWITAYKDGYGRQYGERWSAQSINIVSSNLHEAEAGFEHPDRWLFRFEDVSANFGDFVREWIDYTETFDEALNSYFSTVYHPLTAELSHLALTQALEAYHGIKFSSHHKREFQTKVKELCNLHAVALNGLVNDVTDFAEQVLCSRNYYTHHNPKWLAKGKVAKGEELIRLNEKLRLLFQMCVLADLAVPVDRFARLRRQLSSEIIHYA